jgi:hypothetical protein
MRGFALEIRGLFLSYGDVIEDRNLKLKLVLNVRFTDYIRYFI